MKITRLVYVERANMPDYHFLDTLGVIRLTDYDTLEIDTYSVEDGFEDYTGTKEQYIDLIKENVCSDVYELLENKDIDLIMIV